jgi:hypothetical protein
MSRAKPNAPSGRQPTSTHGASLSSVPEPTDGGTACLAFPNGLVPRRMRVRPNDGIQLSKRIPDPAAAPRLRDAVAVGRFGRTLAP